MLVRFIHSVSRELTDQTLEQTELDFMRDGNPDAEIRCWLAIIASSMEYMEEYPSAPRLSVLRAALLLCMGGEPTDSEMDVAELRAIFQSGSGDCAEVLQRWADEKLGG